MAKAIKKEEEQYAHTTRVGLERLENTPIVLRSGEEMPLRLGRPLHRVIAENPQEHELSFTWQLRLSTFNATQEEEAAYAEFARTWDSRVQFSKIFDAVSANLPPEARAKDWMGHFRVAVNQEACDLSPRHSYLIGLKMLRKREEVVSNRLLRDEIDLLLQRFPARETPAWVPGPELFKLHDTFGLRPDFIESLVRGHGFSVDRAGYDAEMERQRQRGRASWRQQEAGAFPARYSAVDEWYNKLDHFNPDRTPPVQETKVVGIIAGEETEKKETYPGEEIEVFLHTSPFYPEAGGQVGDTGELLDLETNEFLGRVLDTQKVRGLFRTHIVKVVRPFHVGTAVRAVVDLNRRSAIRRNHTATHLLHAALRKTLGTHVKQAGSLVAPDRLRFDFTHYTGLGEQDVLDIEDLVNQHVLANEEMQTQIMDIDAAVATGAMALFGEKYGDQVRVVSVGDGSYSRELCGGTHVRRTGDIGLFKIVSESSVAAGTRRIEALTGTGVLEYLRRESQALTQASEALHAKPDALVEAIEKLTESEKRLRKELEAQQMKRAASAAGDLAQQAREVKGVRVVAARVEVTDRAAMRQMVDDLRVKLQSGVIVLGSVADGRVSLIAAVTRDLTGKLDAGKIVKQAAAFVEGSGGGRKDLAEAGGKNPAKLDEAIQAVPGIIETMA